MEGDSICLISYGESVIDSENVSVLVLTRGDLGESESLTLKIELFILNALLFIIGVPTSSSGIGSAFLD